MGGVDAPPSARRLVLRSASREGGSLKPGGGKSPPDRQRRSFVAPGFVVARSAAPSTKNFEEPKTDLEGEFVIYYFYQVWSLPLNVWATHSRKQERR